MSKIPPNIHFTFLDKKESFPSLFTTCLETVKTMHPGWNIRVYNEDDACEILDAHFPQLRDVYYSYAHTVQRSDMLRILLVYLYGGFYMDLDMLCLKSLEGLRDFSLVLGEEKHISEQETSDLKLQHPLRIANYMFGSTEKHPFWHCLLNQLVRKSSVRVQSENDILESTGPGLLTNVYHAYKKYYPDLTLLRNTDRCCLRPGHHAISCHFGNYAAHLHQGSWRWGTPYSGSYMIAQEPGKKTVRKNPFALVNSQRDNFCVIPFTGRFGKPGNALHHLYRRFGVYPKVKRETQQSGSLTTFVFGNPFSYTDRLSARGTNVLITLWDSVFEQHSPAEVINRYYRCCIVPYKRDKMLLTQAGVKVPVKVIQLGFTKPQRNFDSECEAPLFFTAGVSCTHPVTDLYRIITACKNVREVSIPELRLRLWEPYPNALKKATRAYIERDAEWIDISCSSADLSGWYSSIHCYLSVNERDALYNGPATSLYMGVPAIISQKPSYRVFSNSGYCRVVPVERGIVKEASIEKAIHDMFVQYEHYSELALRGAMWVEDKWSSEKCFHEIVEFLSSGKI